MKFTKIFWGAVLVCFLWQWALGQKTEKPRLPLGAYKTTAKIDLTGANPMYDSAIVILNEAISFYPNDAELHFLLGKAYYHKNMSREMGRHFFQAESLKIQPKFQEEIQMMRAEKWLQVFNQGAKAFNEQKPDTAIEKFTICTILDPQDYRGFMNVGRIYSLKGENDKAISYLKEGLKLAPDTLDLLRLYAVALHNAGKTEEALEIYSKIIKKDPTDASALNNIVSIYVLRKDLDKALLFCQKMIDVDSSFKDAYFNMGWIYVQQIQPIILALDSLKDATGVYRTDEKSKVRKEELEKKRSELFTKAETRLRKTVELDSSDIDAQLLLAQVYLEQEKLDQAVGSLEFLVQKDSHNCEALLKLAAVYAKKGVDKAKETWQKAQDCLKAPLELQSWHWGREGEFVVAEGFVKNISGEKLENVVAVFSVSDANGEFITSDNALIEYDPLLPEQTSPFKVMVRDNPAIQKGEIGFKHLSGESISFRK